MFHILNKQNEDNETDMCIVNNDDIVHEHDFMY
jgi:hypothetical protein